MKENKIEFLSILEIADLVRDKAIEIKSKEADITELQAFNKACQELFRSE